MTCIHNGSLTDVCAPSNWECLSDAEKAMCTRHGPYSPTSDYSFEQEAKAAARARDPMWAFTAGLVEGGLSSADINVLSDIYEAELRAADPTYSQKIRELAELASARQELEEQFGATALNRLIYGGFSPLPPVIAPAIESTQIQAAAPAPPPPTSPSQIQQTASPTASTSPLAPDLSGLSQLQKDMAALIEATNALARTPDYSPDPTLPISPTTPVTTPVTTTPDTALPESQVMMIKIGIGVLVMAVIGVVIFMVAKI